MPSRTVTVYQCDRCQAEEPADSDQAEFWSGVIIPTIQPTAAGQQMLCPPCGSDAKRFMDNQLCEPSLTPAA